MGNESHGGFCIILDKRLTDLFTDLEMAGSDRRAEPCHHAHISGTRFSQGSLDHPTGQPSPARMNDARHGSGAVAHKDRQTVSHEYRADIARAAAECGIAIAYAHAAIIIDIDRDGAMHLFQPRRFARQNLAQQAAVFFDVQWVVADMVAQIEAGISSAAGSTVTRGKQ